MRWLFPTAIVLSGAGLALAWLVDGGPAEVTPAGSGTVAVPHPAKLASAAERPAATSLSAAGALRQGSGGVLPPPGVSAEQWQQILAEHAGRPDGAAEVRRLTEYFHFADALQRFRLLRKAPSAGPEVTTLAKFIDQTLDARVQQREVNGAEARAIKLAVLEVLQPDEAVRQATLRQWQAAAAPVVPQAAEARARDAEFLRQQAALVAAWSARAPGERDQRALERDLAALKQATYAGPGAPAETPSPPRRTP